MRPLQTPLECRNWSRQRRDAAGDLVGEATPPLGVGIASSAAISNRSACLKLSRFFECSRLRNDRSRVCYAFRPFSDSVGLETRGQFRTDWLAPILGESQRVGNPSNRSYRRLETCQAKSWPHWSSSPS